jgi:hypothetical protein
MRTESAVVLTVCFVAAHCSSVIHMQRVKVTCAGGHTCLQANMSGHLLWKEKKDVLSGALAVATEMRVD